MKGEITQTNIVLRISCLQLHTDFSPFRPAHSMSKLRMRNGATFAHSPSGVWDTNCSHETSASIWHRDTWFVGGLSVHWLAGSSTQLHPTSPVSTMNLQQKYN
jgi:hypothetical protein